MIDIATIDFERQFILSLMHEQDATQVCTVLDVAQHENGYWAAQAAGFALLAQLRDDKAAMSQMPLYVMDHRVDDVWENPAYFAAEQALKLACVSPAAGHALSIARAQNADQFIVQCLVDGVACSAIWNQISDEQRFEIRWQPVDLEIEEMLAGRTDQIMDVAA